MSPPSRLALCLATTWLMVMVTFAPSARGDEVAKRQFIKAQELHDTGDFAVALPLFEKALETSGSPNARLYVARCLRELGRLPEAYDHMRRTLDDASARAETEPKYAPTRDAAKTELAGLEKRVARVTITVTGGRNAVVTLNGRKLDRTALGQPRAVPPGAVNVRAEATGAQAKTQTVQVAAGQLTSVALSLEPSAKASAPPPPPPPPPPDESEAEVMTTMRWVGVGVATLGLGGMVSFAVTGSMAQSKLDQLEADCGGARCTDPAQADVVDEGKMLQTIANVSLGVGIAGLVGGSALILFGGPSDEPDVTALVRGTMGGAWVQLGGRF